GSAAGGANGSGGGAAGGSGAGGSGAANGAGGSGFAPVDNGTGTIGAGQYTVQPGDTLGSIAQRSGVTVAQLYQANRDRISLHTIRAGQVITIPQV
ncbi:LysM domain-containing protein, partial [Kocuria sp. HSID17582]